MAAPTLDTVLTGLAHGEATGSLRVGKDGTVYLTRGRVSYVECAATPGVEDLLGASDRITASGVRHARQEAGRSDGGALLVSKGVLSRGELEFCVLSATLDAAFFLLRPFLFQGRTARTRFREGDGHWLGVHWYFDVPGLLGECARRRARLERAWPSDELDTRAVTPLRRIPGTHALLTPLQWELLLAADSTATPVELARRLGHPAYSTLLAVRELAAAGLLATDRAAPDEQPDELPRRTPRPPAVPVADAVTDVNLLLRVRDALEAL
ncbi:MarR family transcriptional regulator [Microbispora triticiradicis]|uniref:MarR family transcriptional regulator n=1 Tax=Microbispora triticiradicis TaxID=2200763 RepID=UPI001AD69356|nr:helix-turn-helix domain-containing protein [Microbispora triticiradicis]MBO4272929.1 transcriptional regulator [Microbispora triticiradicis]